MLRGNRLFVDDVNDCCCCVVAMSIASKSFYETVQESYEEEWTGHPQLVSAVQVGAGMIQGQLFT